VEPVADPLSDKETLPKRLTRSTGDSAPAKALGFLARLASDFTTVLSLPDLLEHVIRMMYEETEFDSCGVSLIDAHDPNVLRILATSGLRNVSRGEAFPRGEGLGWACVESGKPLIVPDMLADPRSYRPQPTIRSGMWAPLLVHGRIIGLVSAFRGAPNAFTPTDLDLLTVVARYLAGAVEVARLYDQLKELAAIDSVTGLANRRFFLDRLHSEIARSRRAGHPLSIALIDLDGFKAVNDAYGHIIGDDVLRQVAQALRGAARESDLVARFGGDEFVLLFPESTQVGLQRVLRDWRIPEIPVLNGGNRTSINFSWGAATWPDDGPDPAALLQAADARLYAMKQARRSSYM
jgi:diguanylate cyclase (GGDEF)-like protein